MKLRDPAVTCAQAGLCPCAVPALCPSAGAAVGLHPTQNNTWHWELKRSHTEPGCALLLVRAPGLERPGLHRAQGSLETLQCPAKAEIMSLVAPKCHISWAQSTEGTGRTVTAQGWGDVGLTTLLLWENLLFLCTRNRWEDPPSHP